MRIRTEEIEKHLSRGLLPIYLLSGDEPLQLRDCADALRAGCRAKGFDERKIFDVDARFDWAPVLGECQNLSLFSDRKLIEIRMPGGKPGAAGSAALREIAARPPADTVIMVLAGKLERDAVRAAWHKAIDEVGGVIPVWPMRRTEMPAWIGRRLQAAGFKPTPDAVNLLCERSEGNLLAASQEIEKLCLLADPGPLNAETVAAAVSDSARYRIFDLGDRALEGDRSAAVRVAQGLRASGEELPPILGALSAELRRLAVLAVGGPVDVGYPGANARSKPHDAAAVKRLGLSGIHAALQRCAMIDRAVKGLEPRDPWAALMDLVISISRRQGVQEKGDGGNKN